MASSIILNAGDLRSAAKEHQRDRNHNAKWARGFAPAPGKKCVHRDWPEESSCCDQCAVRPLHRDEDRRMGRHFAAKKHNWNNKFTAQQTTAARKVFRHDLVDTSLNTSDSSASEEEIADASAAPVPDAEIMYSYDAPSGPAKGNDVLSHAVSKAVQRYENKVTEKIAREYDFVDAGKDLGDGYIADADDAEEDDFELIDHDSLQ